jgi:hypothetical protein
MRPLIFLDFDDVLAVHREHNSAAVQATFKANTLDNVEELWDGLFHYSARMNLRTLHGEFTPEYVITSSWTLHFDLAQIIEVLRRTDLVFVAENLHPKWRTPREQGVTYRLTEIEAWLDEHNLTSARPFVILDDELSGQSIPGSNLESRSVLCDAWTGFMYPQLRAAQLILHQQLSSASDTKEQS